jgi:hypothetical protein
MALGRAVSIDDFETVALQSPGVTRALAALVVDPDTQRPGVIVWVDDDPAAVTAARAAFAASADPNRQPTVQRAQETAITLTLTVMCDPRYVARSVQAAVRAALADPDSGLLGDNVVAIGQVFYESQVHAACLAVPGVVSVHSLEWSPPASDGGERHDPGPSAYFALKDDGLQPVIVTEPAS